MREIKLTYCGIEAAGRTVTDAKKQATRDLTRLVHDIRRYPPTVVACKGNAQLVYRGAESWHILAIASDGEFRTGFNGYSCGYASRDEAIRTAAHHVADLSWQFDVSDDAQFARDALAPYLPADILDREVRERVDYWAWQRRYRKAKDDGYSDNAAHQIAGGLGHLVENGTIK